MSRYAPLPTLTNLNASVPPGTDAKRTASAWFDSFASRMVSCDVGGVLDHFLEDAFWRDLLALSWDFRTFSGKEKMNKFLSDRLLLAKPTNFRLRDEYLALQRPFPDLAWISAMFDFETDVGLASGVFRLVPTSTGEWKAHGILTNLEDLKGFPEQLGPRRGQSIDPGEVWAENRRRECEFKDADPAVLIIGGGQSGLGLAARLKCLNISALVVEKNPRIGDNWRDRYEALCLHDPVWYDHMPYLPFPPTWPVYTPAMKLAGWLESYADIFDLNVWTSSPVISARPTPSNKWSVTVRRPDGQERVLNVNHVIFSTGLGSGEQKMPIYPGMELFRGQILHSTEHKRAMDHAGKKVVIIGACTSAHDIAVDYYDHGIDVTIFQRSSTYIRSTKHGWRILMKALDGSKCITRYIFGGCPPADIADRLQASFPYFMGIGLAQRRTRQAAEADKMRREILDALQQRGFRINMDTGASTLVAEGKIGLKNDSPLQEFTERGLRFENGSELEADVVLFATGFDDAREGIRKICGDDVHSKCKPIWGLNEEGEIRGVWRELGVPGLWTMMGNLALCRFHSKHLALQIKAIEEGVFGVRYADHR
ncbi:hypothetical protein BD779DRAFT_1612399 [Infundibulicybe gibba]|nr:hypothetical protein BD779DRAFT_1612399 [Infundibulicybe gibba]